MNKTKVAAAAAVTGAGFYVAPYLMVGAMMLRAGLKAGHVAWKVGGDFGHAVTSNSAEAKKNAEKLKASIATLGNSGPDKATKVFVGLFLVLREGCIPMGEGCASLLSKLNAYWNSTKEESNDEIKVDAPDNAEVKITTDGERHSKIAGDLANTTTVTAGSFSNSAAPAPQDRTMNVDALDLAGTATSLDNREAEMKALAGSESANSPTHSQDRAGTPGKGASAAAGATKDPSAGAGADTAASMAAGK